MNYLILYLFIITALCLASVYFLMRGGLTITDNSSRFKKNRLSRFAKDIKSQVGTLDDKELNNVFKRCGFAVSSVFYRVSRIMILGLVFAYMLYLRFYVGAVSTTMVVSWLIVFVVSYPKLEFFGMKTPFYAISNFFMSEYKNRLNAEVFRAISQLKNLSIAQASKPVGSVFILQELMKYSKRTKTIFARTLSLFMQNKPKEGADYFADAIGTRQASEFANLFVLIDNLNPVELKEQLEMYQDYVSNEKRTAREKSNEYKGYVVYGLVVTSVSIVFFNFMVIVLFIDMLERFAEFSIK